MLIYYLKFTNDESDDSTNTIQERPSKKPRKKQMTPQILVNTMTLVVIRKMRMKLTNI